jgi:hypothetical protein
MKKCAILIFLYLISSALWAKTELPGIRNAGGGGHFSPIFGADSIHFGKIKIQKQLILVNLYPGFAVVKGEYSFINTTDQPINIKIGYPANGHYPQRIVENVFYNVCFNFRAKANGITVRPYRVSDSGRQSLVNFNGTKSSSTEVSTWFVWQQEFPADTVTTLTVYFITQNNLARFKKGNQSRDANAFGYVFESNKALGGSIAEGQILVKMNENLSLIEVLGILPDSLLKGDLHHLQYSFSNAEPESSNNLLIWYDGAPLDFKFDKKVLPSTDTLYQLMDAFPISEFNDPSFTMISRKNFTLAKSGLTFTGVMYFLMFFLPWIILAGVIVFLLKSGKKIESGKRKIES